ncbi:MAG: glycosyltransferase [Patescibacteria group bacterium]|nr:glycosyltransferase [Patescibacteria group bacterium]
MGQTISVVVVTRNRKDKLKRCIDSLMRHLPNSELIVIDNGSNDGTPEYLKSLDNVTVIRKDYNTGVSAARNIGISVSNEKICMIIDDDAWIETIKLDDVVSLFAQNGGVHVLVPKILYPDGRIQESVRKFPRIRNLVYRVLGLYRLFPNSSLNTSYIIDADDDRENIDWAIGACLIFRRNIFNHIGLFDEGYFYGYEDADLFFRLKEHGGRSIYMPNIIVNHEYARTSSKLFRARFLNHTKSILRYFHKTHLRKHVNVDK